MKHGLIFKTKIKIYCFEKLDLELDSWILVMCRIKINQLNFLTGTKGSSKW